MKTKSLLSLLLALSLLFLCGCGHSSYYDAGGHPTGAAYFGIPEGDLPEVPEGIDTYYASCRSTGCQYYIYDSDYLYLVLDYGDISLEDLFDAIDANSSIPDRFRPLFREFCQVYVTNAPTAERRILYHNLQTLVVNECDDMALIMATSSTASTGAYNSLKNEIYLLSDYVFEKGTWDYQVLYHELCHAARYANWEDDSNEYRITPMGSMYYCVLLDETLNTIFSCSLLGYDEPDLAYQFFSNLVIVMMENIDNYEPVDYSLHSDAWFIRALDEYTGEYVAADMIDLMDVMRNDYIDEGRHHFQRRYFPLYDYVADLYFNGRITPDMSRSEARAVADELIARLSFDVPEDYHVRWSHFRSYAVTYLRELRRASWPPDSQPHKTLPRDRLNSCPAGFIYIYCPFRNFSLSLRCINAIII